jgi:hypothetical protein
MITPMIKKLKRFRTKVMLNPYGNKSSRVVRNTWRQKLDNALREKAYQA